MTDFLTYRNRRARGHILNILKINLPHSVPDAVIYDCLLDGGYDVTEAETESFLLYLKDREYIEMKKANPAELRLWRGRGKYIIRLTSKGEDVVEGTIEDPGVTVKGPR